MQLGLTPRLRSLKQFLSSRIEADGVAPSFDEMRLAMGLQSKSGVHRMILALEERGHIQRMPDRARAISIIGGDSVDTADALRIVLGRCKMSAEATHEITRLLAAEEGHA